MGSCIQSFIYKNQMNRHLLGLDLGTSSVKLVLTDGDGRIIDAARESYPVLGKEDGRYEQDPDHWCTAIVKAVVKLRTRNDLSRVSAIGLSGQMPSLVVLNNIFGDPMGNSILWCDPRADDLAKDLLKKWGGNEHYLKTGVVLDGRYLIPMYLWRRNRGQVVNHQILSAKDFICYWLCGELVTDPSTASGYGVYSLRKKGWDEELCEIAEITPDALPEIKDSAAVIGHMKEDTAAILGLSTDIKIINGGADSVCGVLGSGGTDIGTVSQMWGTGTAIIGITGEPELNKDNKYFVTPMAEPETFGLEADLISTGETFRHIEEMLGSDWEQKVKEIPAGSEGLLGYPYINGGEQGVLWEPELTAGYIDLKEENKEVRDHDYKPEYKANALLEGMCFEVKRCLDAFDMEIKKIVCMGYASENPYFMQMMANVLGKDCTAIGDSGDSALGAAYLAGIGTGLWTYDSIPKPTGDKEVVFAPDANTHNIYKVVYNNYIENTFRMK